MAAAQLVEPGHIEIVEVARPEPAPGQVRVALEGCGVCASNLPVWGGRPWFSYPLPPGALGHEGWGRVDAIGEGVGERWLGRRVATLSEHAYAEFDLAAVDDVVPLPDAKPKLAPVEPFGCLFNVLERSALEPDAWVAVVGLGFMGLGMVRLAVESGARVIALSSNLRALETAESLGAEGVVPLAPDAAVRRQDASAQVDSLTDGGGCARVIECTGHQGPLDLAGDLVAEGGRLVIAGYHQDGERRVDLQQWNWKGIDVVNAHERSPARIRRGMTRAAETLAADPSWTETLITHRYALDDLGSALARAADRPPGFVKGTVLTRWART